MHHPRRMAAAWLSLCASWSGVRVQGQRRRLDASMISESQWHLHNDLQPGNDVNVLAAWEAGYTGRGVIVGLVDDGIEYWHESLDAAVRLDLSWDFNTDHPDPLPQSEQDKHGTRCAGQIAAQPHGKCGVGVAPGAELAALRLLGGAITTEKEAAAVTWRNDAIDIYSCSWGPADDGRSIEGPHQSVLKAFLRGLREGRKGLGSVFVFAAGNGKKGIDNCNFDGYANGPFSITIGAIDRFDTTPPYMEACSAMLAVTYSSGPASTDSKETLPLNGNYKIVTTDINGACTKVHGGTSAAAPLAAGLFALVLEARPDLSWRDLQHVTVKAARPILDTAPGSWIQNGAGHWFSPWFGFGKLDAERLIQVARASEPVGPLAIVTSPWMSANAGIWTGSMVAAELFIDERQMRSIARLEHVAVTVSVRMLPGQGRRGDLVFALRSLGSGTRVPLTSRRPLDADEERAGLRSWTLTTVAFWGEQAETSAAWELAIECVDELDHHSRVGVAELVQWRVSLFGEAAKPTFAYSDDQFLQVFHPRLQPSTLIHPAAAKASIPCIASSIAGLVAGIWTAHFLVG